MNRKYLPTLSELIDRLSIAQLKEVLHTPISNEGLWCTGSQFFNV